MLDSQRIQEAYAHVQQRVKQTPRVALILGTGLGQFADRIENPVAISYTDIPHFPLSSAPQVSPPAPPLCGFIFFHFGYILLNFEFISLQGNVFLHLN